MASITTQIVSKAAAGAAATLAQVVREAVQIARPQLQKSSRVEADRVTLSGSKNDAERAPSEPKRTEATYTRGSVRRNNSDTNLPSEENREQE